MSSHAATAAVATVVVTVVAVLVGVPVAHGLDNHLGRLPALGWNSDYCLNCSTSNGFQNEQFIRQLARFMNSSKVTADGKTLLDLGYKYVNMDASWNLPSRSPSGDLVPDPKLWPSGFKSTVDYVHSLGLGFGIYGDRGTKDCAGHPGALGHEKQDAEFMVKNEIDFYKEDSCFATGDKETALSEYGAMRDALNQTGRPIWFALCGWETFYASDPKGGTLLANSARIGPDTGQGWAAVMTNTMGGLSVSQYAGPSGTGGYWNDGSLQLLPGMRSEKYVNNGEWNHLLHEITPDRHRSQFSIWSMLAMNILLTGNLSSLDPYAMQTWTNEEVLAVNQDPLGKAALEIPIGYARHPSGAYTNKPQHLEVGSTLNPAYTAECGGEPELQNWTFNAPLAGHLSNAKTKVCLNVADCKNEVIYDGCENGGCGPNEIWTVDGSTIKSGLPGNKCLAMDPYSSHVNTATCSGDATQQWVHDPATGQIKSHTGKCITAPGATPSASHLAMWRPLADGSRALLVLNNDNTPASVACNQACFDAMGLGDASASYTVRDLWLHQDVQKSVKADTGFNATVSALGSSVVFKITKQ